MPNFTSNTYQMKRKILTFSNKISRRLSKPDKKFTADITYGILASQSCLLTDVADQLHEPSKKINIVDRLSRHLEKGTPASAAASYLRQVKKLVPEEPVVHIDDSDVVKPEGSKFESLGIVRDGSESTSAKSVYKKGYHVTEACVLTRSNHPVSIFSRIHSSSEKDYKSVNTITFQAMERGAALFGKATFCMDRGYDDNKMFLKLDDLKQDYVIRLKSNRKLLYHNRWTMASQLRDRRKGKAGIKEDIPQISSENILLSALSRQLHSSISPSPPPQRPHSFSSPGSSYQTVRPVPSRVSPLLWI